MKHIYSPQNPFIKQLVKLGQKVRERKKSGRFLIEGKREITLAIEAGYYIDNVLFCSDILSFESVSKFVPDSIDRVEISQEVYSKLAYRNSTEGVVAVVRAKDFSLQSIVLKNKYPLILVLESIEKPGNIGALLRTADAARVDAVFISGAKTDLYNPNVIRSSLGCVFTVPIAIGNPPEIIDFLKRRNITIYSATLQNSNPYFKQDYTKPTAIVLGSEANGLSQIWTDESFKNILIPMQGSIDSMNVSVAGAVLIFEAKRQRKFLEIK